jgi:hypothetical protein
MNAKLECTTNYGLFEMHECNRPLHEDPILLESMKEHGFMPSSPIQCKRNGNGKLKVLRGHHRLHYAKRLKLPVYFVIDETNTDITGLEASTRQQWNGLDFAIARSKAGDKDCSALLEFQKKHSLTLGAAASLVGGESAGSSNKIRLVKAGAFKVGDMKHANDVVAITDICREAGLSFATSTAFVKAISMVLRIPEFDSKLFCHRVRLYAANVRKRGKVDEYLDEIEALYNYGARGKRLPVRFRAEELSRDRQLSFGGRQTPKGKWSI